VSKKWMQWLKILETSKLNEILKPLPAKRRVYIYIYVPHR
jgi:hypothetical protein